MYIYIFSNLQVDYGKCRSRVILHIYENDNKGEPVKLYGILDCVEESHPIEYFHGNFEKNYSSTMKEKKERPVQKPEETSSSEETPEETSEETPEENE